MSLTHVYISQKYGAKCGPDFLPRTTDLLGSRSLTARTTGHSKGPLLESPRPPVSVRPPVCVRYRERERHRERESERQREREREREREKEISDLPGPDRRP